MTKSLFLIFVLPLSLFLSAQTGTTVKYDFFKKYSVQEQQEDFKIVKTSLERIDPGLFMHITEEDFEKEYNRLFNIINKEQTSYQFLNCIYDLIADIHCGHTETNLSLSEVEFKNTTLPHFPYTVKIINDKVYIQQNFTKDSLFKPGTEIRSINGIKVSDLIQKFMTISYVDGFNKQAELTYLSFHFKTFTEYYFNIPNEYSMEILSPDGKVIQKKAEASTWSEIKDIYHEKYPIEPNRMEIIDSLKTAVLTFNTFYDPSYVKLLRRTFKTIKQKHIQTLVIDLRNNRGGQGGFGSRLYSYLALSPFKFCDHIEMRLDSVNDPILKYGAVLYPHRFKVFFDKNHSKKMADGNYILKKNQHPVGVKSPKKNNFKSKVFILISGKTFSGASDFAAVTHFHQRATFIGQETAGGYCQETSGFNYILILPNTKIRVAIPVCRYFEAVDNCKSNGGVKPDYEIKPEVSDLNSNIDREMKFTLDLVKKK